jgi:hypothetical protein
MSEKNLYENEDPTWKTHMEMLTRRKRNMEIARIIDEALYEHYVVEQGKPVPNWRYIKDQDWWVEYLKTLGLNERNEPS